jgi:UDP:flavonoid glycosyltransferase YjiC (YdhE family)
MSRLLFVAEGVTLAHVGRPILLASAMAQRGHEVTLAAPERCRRWAPKGVRWRALKSQSPESFARRLREGRRLYSQGQLKGYIADELNLFSRVRPDVVFGDFRLSLAASARTAGVPYAAIANAYWSPQRRLRPPPPSIDFVKKLAFRVGWPLALRWHATGIGEVLKPHGVEIGNSLQRAYTEADLTLFADHPGLFPEVEGSFLGPVAWEPDVALPNWWESLPESRPVAYLSMGSSGAGEALPLLARGLVAEGFEVVVATTGCGFPDDMAHTFAADYLPGSVACARAEVVVCNGGSPSVNQALAAGRPVIGVCSNLDQYLNMQAVQAHGAGLMLRSDALSLERVRAAVRRLREGSFAQMAQALKASAAGMDAGEICEAALGRLRG